MNPNYLDFEQPIADLEAKIHELRQASNGPAVNIDAEINALQDKLRKRTAHIFRDLSPWQVSQLARHPMRPYTLDYVRVMCDEFEELAGDRAYADDPAIVGGLGRIDGRPVVIIGHQKGRDTKSKVRRNFGMPRPEGYRKALRLMKLAERFRLPLLTFIDTPGAYPGIGAEERGQSEAIARNLLEMAELRTPVLCTVIGEGGSGGALAIGVGDRTVMLEYSIYSVISPEGCASILWKDAAKARDAAEQLGLTARRLHELKLVDRVMREPIGGAHRNPRQTAIRLKSLLLNELDALAGVPLDELMQRRYQRLRGYGAYETGYGIRRRRGREPGDGDTTMVESIDSINLRTMTDASVVAHYARPWDLSPAEQATFERVAALAGGRPILDIGVGGGRTVEPLRRISSDYLGIDYSPGM